MDIYLKLLGGLARPCLLSIAALLACPINAKGADADITGPAQTVWANVHTVWGMWPDQAEAAQEGRGYDG